ncbi:oxygen-binding di-iron domain-containing protein [Actinophytocola sediminis]
MTAIELAPGLYRLGGIVPIDGRLSWRAPGVTGFEPIGCYLLLGDGRALLIGTGVRLHQEQVLEQIRGLLGGRELEIYADRNEADEIGNLPAVVSAFGVRRIFFAGAGHLLRWFEHDGFDGKVPDTELVFLLPAGNSRAIDLESDRPSEVDFGAGRLELLHTNLTTLGFAWLYDRTTRTLFSSDFFAEVPMRTEEIRGQVDFEQVKNHIFTRFYWMRDAEKQPLLDNLDAVFAGREIERLCPYHGCVIEGAENVRRHLAYARRTLGAA